MEPRTHARGNAPRTIGSIRWSGRFNGATHSRAWKPGGQSANLLGLGLLQWSHALTRVETMRKASSMSGDEYLQWSHALTRVETPEEGYKVVPKEIPSMEPRTHARGNTIGEK